MKKYLLAALLCSGVLSSTSVLLADEMTREQSRELALAKGCPPGFWIAHLRQYPDDLVMLRPIQSVLLTTFFSYLVVLSDPLLTHKKKIKAMGHITESEATWDFEIRPWMIEFVLKELAVVSDKTKRKILAITKGSAIYELVVSRLDELAEMSA